MLIEPPEEVLQPSGTEILVDLCLLLLVPEGERKKALLLFKKSRRELRAWRWVLLRTLRARAGTA